MESFANSPIKPSGAQENQASTVSVQRLARYHVEQVLPDIESIAKQVVHDRDRARQSVEDSRANHRNLNRMLTLLGALVIGLGVTWSLTSGAANQFIGAHNAKVLSPYSFVITVCLDASLAAYSLIRKY